VQGKGCEVQPGPLEGGGGREGHLKPSRPRLETSRPKVCTGNVREPLRFPKNEMRCNLDLLKEAVCAYTRLTHRTRLPPAHIAFFNSLICIGAHDNSAACGTHSGNGHTRFAPLLRAGGAAQGAGEGLFDNPGPCLGTVWADTDNPVYRIEIKINEIDLRGLGGEEEHGGEPDARRSIGGREDGRREEAALPPRTSRNAPYTLHPTLDTQHPTPSILQPSPYTLHPTPYTLHTTPYTLEA